MCLRQSDVRGRSRNARTSIAQAREIVAAGSGTEPANAHTPQPNGQVPGNAITRSLAIESPVSLRPQMGIADPRRFVKLDPDLQVGQINVSNRQVNANDEAGLCRWDGCASRSDGCARDGRVNACRNVCLAPPPSRGWRTAAGGCGRARAQIKPSWRFENLISFRIDKRTGSVKGEPVDFFKKFSPTCGSV